MNQQDDWGRDPGVLSMRRVFAAMESAHNDLLDRLGMNPWEPRLGRWRQRARNYFERAWPRLSGLAPAPGESGAGAVYAHCLAQAMIRDGVDVPLQDLPGGPELNLEVQKTLD
ncbi:MAG: hypothetical protein PVG03_03100 [Desulfarculaceae bacterium]